MNMFSKMPPSSISQLRADTAVARSISVMKNRRGRGTDSGTHRSSRGPAVQSINRSRSAPLGVRVATSQLFTAPKKKNPQTSMTRSKSLPYRNGQGGSGSRFSKSHTLTSVMPSTAKYTPTKLELHKIRTEHSIDRRGISASYPVAPSPVKLGTITKSPRGDPVSRGNSYKSRGRQSEPRGASTPRKDTTEMEREIESLRCELNAEREHSKALAQQVREATSSLDAEKKSLKAELSKFESTRKRLEATATQAVTDREEIRRRSATEISSLRLELQVATMRADSAEELCKQQEDTISILKERLGSISVPAAPISPTQRKPSAPRVSFNPEVDIKEMSSVSPEKRLTSPSSEHIPPPPPDGSPPVVDAELRRDLKDMFDEYDYEASGHLSEQRVRSAYAAMETTFGLEPQEISFDFPSEADDTDRVIAFPEFVKIMSVLPTRLATETALLATEPEASKT
eukprot:TRINITY_DN4504_c0_g1_i1.p1 TRINITY_DN4504_c0_g1~~TRINITY_DN4504_c0_g1_i1.p1  ORF type:complete len:457 (+),score=96.93 TRINITY_DN4504_c0_g1_i1:56-1426(+)